MYLWYFSSLPLSLCPILWNLHFLSFPEHLHFAHRDIQGLEITVPVCQMMQLYRSGKKKKKWTGLLCRFKFRNRREEKDNSRALGRQSYSHVKGGEIEGCLFFCVTCSEKLNASIVPPRIKPFGTAVCGQFVLCFWPIQKVVWKLKLPDNVSLSVLLLLQYLIMKNNSLKACWIIFPK